MMAHLSLAVPAPLVTAGCPAWCDGEHDDFDSHSNASLPPVEVTELIEGKPAVLDVFIEQSEDQPEARVTLAGALFPHDAQVSLDDAERIAQAILTQVATARRAGR